MTSTSDTQTETDDVIADTPKAPLLERLFTPEGAEQIRKQGWMSIGVIALGILGDFASLFGGWTLQASLICLSLLALFSLIMILRRDLCRACALPFILLFILFVTSTVIVTGKNAFAAPQYCAPEDTAQTCPPESLTKVILQWLGIIEDKIDGLVEMAEGSQESDTKQEVMLRALLEAQGINPDSLTPQERLNFREAVQHILDSTDSRDAPAAKALKDGDVTAAINLRTQRLSLESQSIQDINREHARQWRETGALAFPIDTTEAIGAYENAIRFDGNTVWDFIFLNRLYVRGGNLNAAKSILNKASELENSSRDQSVLLNEIGNVAKRQDDLTAARKAYEDGLAIRDRLAKADPSNTGFQRDLSVSYERIGDVAIAQGELPAAQKAYEDALAIRDTLAKADPSDTGFQRDLSVSYERLGDIAVAQGDLPAARKAYEDALAIRDTLAKADPSNSGVQRDLFVSYTKIGDIADAQGELPAARKAYEDALAIVKALAKADPSNTGLQRDLMASYWRLADLGGPDAKGHWQSAYDVMKALDEAGKMQPVDQIWLDRLAEKVGAE